jgi:hypothetical protein
MRWYPPEKFKIVSIGGELAMWLPALSRQTYLKVTVFWGMTPLPLFQTNVPRLSSEWNTKPSIQAVCSSKISVSIYQTTRCYSTNRNFISSENLKFHILVVTSGFSETCILRYIQTRELLYWFRKKTDPITSTSPFAGNWLSRSATIRKVVGSNPDEFIEFFYFFPVAIWSWGWLSPLTEMSNRNIPGGGGG